MSVVLTYFSDFPLGWNVMYQKLQDQVQTRADLLLAGRFDDLAPEYLFPMPVYVNDQMIPLRCPAEGINRAAALRDLLQRRQVDMLKITVKAVELPRAGRFRVYADWHALSQTAKQSQLWQLTYYMRDTAQGVRSEMLHYHSPVCLGCDVP